MTANRKRVALVAGLLAALLLAGVFWLVRTVTAPATTNADAEWRVPSAEPTVPPAPVPPATAPSATIPSATIATTSPPRERTSQARPPDPPRPARTIDVRGPTGGGVIDDPCVRLVNPFGATAEVRGVGFDSRDEGLALTHARCAESAAQVGAEAKAPCQNRPRLAPGEGCYAGIRLTDGEEDPDGEGTELAAFLRVTMRLTCTDSARAPCDEPAVERLGPSAGSPVVVDFSGVCEDDSCRVVLHQRVAAKSSEPSPS